MSDRHILENDTVRIAFDPEGGHMDEVVFRLGGREIRPLHRAPWRDDGKVPADTPVVLKNLAGDFFCAPFCAPDIEPAPWHGWTSNAFWALETAETGPDGAVTTRFRLEKPVLSASVTKSITLRPGHPVVYQRHEFEGGEGALPVAHHAMVRTDNPVILSFSPKAYGLTPDTPVETDPALGRSALAYPQRFGDLSELRGADGSPIDGSRHPIDDEAEDLAILIDAPGRDFAWSAALSPDGGFLFLGLKNPAILPATMLWMSNFGRRYAPWSGRHGHCLGIEEICAAGGLGHAASIRPNALNEAGVATALSLRPDGILAIPYAFGAIPVDRNWQQIRSVNPGATGLAIQDEGGESAELPFDIAALSGSA